MEREPRRFRVKTNIMGGGLSLRAGQFVDESQLLGYADWLERENGIEEIPAVLEWEARVGGLGEQAFTA